MEVRNSKDINFEFSCYQGKITTTANELAEVFGENTHGVSGDNKITREWILEFTHENGKTIATIYDWKTGGIGDDEEYDWHIGGFEKDAVNCVINYFNKKVFDI